MIVSTRAQALVLLLIFPVASSFTLPSPSAAVRNNRIGNRQRQRPNANSLLLLSSTTTATATEAWRSEAVTATDFIICGGGPAGLLSAIMLAQKFPEEKVKLYDRLGPPPNPSDEKAWSDVAKFYLIGLGSRGQFALEQFGLLQDVKDKCVAVVGRRDWAPDADEGVERIFEDRKVQTIVLPRDKLVGILHQEIIDKYSDRIELNYGYEIQPLDFGTNSDDDRVFVRASQCSSAVSNLSASEEKTASEQQQEILCDTDQSAVISSKLLIAADGTVRTVANAIQKLDATKWSAMSPIQRLLAGKPFQVIRYPDDNRRIYKTIPMIIPDDWRGDINYSARSKGSRVVFDALPANSKGEYCGVLLLREDDSMAQANADPVELRALLEEALPSFSAIIDDDVLEKVAKKPPSYLPAFRYIGPRLNEGKKTLIIGDCAHTVKPYFGLGANSALEDVKILGDIIDKTDNLGEAVESFSNTRSIEAKKLVTISRELDRPGGLGFITFILPIILDAIFHKSFPKIFSPNVITMLQRDDLTFTQVAKKKRLDRLGQALLLWGGGYGMFAASKFALISLSKALGRKTSTISFGVAGVLASVLLLKKLAPFFVPGLAPADVMTKTLSKVS